MTALPKSMIKGSSCAILTPQAATIDSLFNHHSVRVDGPEESYTGVGLLMAPTQSIADNSQAVPVIDDLVRNSPCEPLHLQMVVLSK